MKAKNIVAVVISGGLLMACNGGSGSQSTPNQNGLSFTKVGAPYVFLNKSKYTISANNGVISLIVTPRLSLESTIELYSINETATQDNGTKKEIILPDEYVFQGSTVVSNDNTKVYVSVLDSNNKYGILNFDKANGTFSNLGTYITKWNMMQSYGYEWNQQVYMVADDGSGQKGNLCWSNADKIDQTATCTNSGVLPTWYTGRYIVDNNNVYYGTSSALFVSSFDGSIRQVGQNAAELEKQNYQLAFPLPQMYNNDIYFVGVDLIHERPILCHINKNADANSNWQCSVETSNILDGDIYLTDFYIDKTTGMAIISTEDDDVNVQLYKAKI